MTAENETRFTTERFTQEQVEQLKADLDRSHVKSVDRGGRSASYVEGYHVIKEANRIFGFGGWESSITDLHCVESSTQGNHNYEGHDRNGNPRHGYLVAYTARVKVTVDFGGLDGQSHEDVGYGEGIDYNNVGQAHESAIKEAVTDAEKRALRHWGNQFGLALYDKEQREVTGTAAKSSPQQGGHLVKAAMDAGGTVQQPSPSGGTLATKYPSEKQISRLFALGHKSHRTKEQMQDLVRGYGVSEPKNLSIEAYDELCAYLETLAVQDESGAA